MAKQTVETEKKKTFKSFNIKIGGLENKSSKDTQKEKEGPSNCPV